MICMIPTAKPLSLAYGSPAPLVGEPLAGRFCVCWTKKFLKTGNDWAPLVWQRVQKDKGETK